MQIVKHNDLYRQNKKFDNYLEISNITFDFYDFLIYRKLNILILYFNINIINIVY